MGGGRALVLSAGSEFRVLQSWICIITLKKEKILASIQCHLCQTISEKPRLCAFNKLGQSKHGQSDWPFSIFGTFERLWVNISKSKSSITYLSTTIYEHKSSP
jgi:hypothetical protein